jgi:hypothetical protein
VEVDMNIGAEAMDYKLLAKSEKLDPLELELRKLEKVVQEILEEMNYLKTREALMRDTNGKRIKKMETTITGLLIRMMLW